MISENCYNCINIGRNIKGKTICKLTSEIVHPKNGLCKKFNSRTDNIDPTAVVEKIEMDNAFYAQKLGHYKLSKAQIKFFNAITNPNVRQVLGLFSRQTGKTTVSALAVTKILCFPQLVKKEGNFKGHYLAPIQDQADIGYARAVEIIKGSTFLNNYLEYRAGKIWNPMGDMIQYMSASPGSHIRGYTSDIIFIDETQDVTDDKYYADILPFGATTNAKIVETGTPQTKNHFFSVMGSIKPPTGILVRQPWWECPFISKEYVQERKNNSPDALFRQEFCCEFVESAVTVIPEAIARKAQREYFYKYQRVYDNKFHDFLMGVDLGKTSDATEISIVDVTIEPAELRWQETLAGETGNTDLSYTQIARKIAKIYKFFQPREINIDYTGEKGVSDLLVDFGVPLTDNGVSGKIVFNVKNKWEMANNLNVLLDNELLTIPRDDEGLFIQLIQQQKEESATGRIKLFHPSNSHDDKFWSLALAVKNVKPSIEIGNKETKLGAGEVWQLPESIKSKEHKKRLNKIVMDNEYSAVGAIGMKKRKVLNIKKGLYL